MDQENKQIGKKCGKTIAKIKIQAKVRKGWERHIK